MAEDCVEIELLAAYVEHTLRPEEVRRVEAHLVHCRLCRRTVLLTLRTKLEIPDPTPTRQEDDEGG